MQPPERREAARRHGFAEGIGRPAERRRGLLQIVLQQPGLRQHRPQGQFFVAGQRGRSKDRGHDLRGLGATATIERGAGTRQHGLRQRRRHAGSIRQTRRVHAAPNRRASALSVSWKATSCVSTRSSAAIAWASSSCGTGTENGAGPRESSMRHLVIAEPQLRDRRRTTRSARHRADADPLRRRSASRNPLRQGYGGLARHSGASPRAATPALPRQRDGESERAPRRPLRGTARSDRVNERLADRRQPPPVHVRQIRAGTGRPGAASARARPDGRRASAGCRRRAAGPSSPAASADASPRNPPSTRRLWARRQASADGRSRAARPRCRRTG